MSKRAAVAFAVALLASSPGRAAVTSAELIEHGREYDGREVEFVGEAIGDPMPRGDHLWVNVSDGSNSALGVWVAGNDWPAIRFYGSADARGDVVRVRGIFSRSCAEHGGDIDIHAASVVVVEPGAPTPNEVRSERIWLAVALLGSSLVTFLLWKRREKRMRAEEGRPGSWKS
jgi:hypothetical protein